MNRPLSWKNLTAVSNVLITHSPVADLTAFAVLKSGLLRRRGSGRGRHRVVAHLAAEHVAVHRRQRLVEHAAWWAARQVALQRLLPRHDVEHLRQLAVADDLRALDVGAVLREGGRCGHRHENDQQAQPRHGFSFRLSATWSSLRFFRSATHLVTAASPPERARYWSYSTSARLRSCR